MNNNNTCTGQVKARRGAWANHNKESLFAMGGAFELVLLGDHDHVIDSRGPLVGSLGCGPSLCQRISCA